MTDSSHVDRRKASAAGAATLVGHSHGAIAQTTQWLRARAPRDLEGLTGFAELAASKEAWADAYRHTPHEPIVLERSAQTEPTQLIRPARDATWRGIGSTLYEEEPP